MRLDLSRRGLEEEFLHERNEWARYLEEKKGGKEKEGDPKWKRMDGEGSRKKGGAEETRYKKIAMRDEIGE